MRSSNVSFAILLPPSEGKASGGGDPIWHPNLGAYPLLEPQRAAVVAALAQQGGGDRKLLGIGGANLAVAQHANRSLHSTPTMPASLRYTGVVWDYLGLATLKPSARQRASESIIVVSGLLGLASIDDPTPYYKLKMGSSLAPIGKLSTWWRPTISAILNQVLEDRYVIDLLPQEHRAAWSPSSTQRGVSVGFVERDGKIAGHDAKAAKGRLARHILTSTAQPKRSLSTWDDPRFDLRLQPIQR